MWLSVEEIEKMLTKEGAKVEKLLINKPERSNNVYTEVNFLLAYSAGVSSPSQHDVL